MRKPTAIPVMALLLLASMPLPAQSPGLKSLVGTVSGLKPEAAEIQIKPDNAAAISAKLTPDTIAQKIAPGEKDLKQAKTIQVTDVSVGDRVLITLASDGVEVRRIVVMSASDIARRNAADRADWTRRGVAGIVASRKGNQITLKMRTLQAVVEATVTVSEKTSFKRYTPDSVRFADAKTSGIAEVGAGDQLRARGRKSEDGLQVTAEEVVFGTFVTKAGSITAVNADAAGAKEITVRDLVTNKPLVIKFAPDSQIKRMPDLAAMLGAMGGRGAATPGAAAAARGTPPPAASAAGRGLASLDVAQMLEMMPSIKVENLKPGETIVVSSTKGAKADQITAIMLITNADLIVQMASAAGTRGISQLDAAVAAGSMGSGLGGLNMPSIMP
jgi:hypothetical protein